MDVNISTHDGSGQSGTRFIARGRVKSQHEKRNYQLAKYIRSTALHLITRVANMLRPMQLMGDAYTQI